MPTFIKPGFWRELCNPCDGYEGWLNLDDLINAGTSGAGTSGRSGTSGTSGSSGLSGGAGTSGSAGTSGLTGSTGTSGSSGYSGDRYYTTTSTNFTLGTTTTLTIGTGLAYSPAQDVIIAHDVDNHQICTVVSYDANTGIMVIGPPVTVVGSGTYTGMSVNLNGAAGGDGSSGTSGSSVTSGSSGLAGTSGSAGTSGITGTNGSSGTTGTSGSSGTSPIFPLPLVYGLYAQTANSTIVTGTTAETSLIGTGVGTLSVPANGFTVGDSFRVDFGGVLSTGNNQTIRIRLKTGSVILTDSGVQTISNVSNDIWNMSINFTIRALGAAGAASIVTLGKFNYSKTVNGTVEGFSFNVVNNTTFDTTISNTLDCTVEFGSTSGANSIYSDIFVLNKIY